MVQKTKSINVAVDASGLDKGTAVYAEDMNVVSSGTLGIGKNGIGIYVKGSATNTEQIKVQLTLHHQKLVL